MTTQRRSILPLKKLFETSERSRIVHWVCNFRYYSAFDPCCQPRVNFKFLPSACSGISTTNIIQSHLICVLCACPVFNSATFFFFLFFPPQTRRWSCGSWPVTRRTMASPNELWEGTLTSWVTSWSPPTGSSLCPARGTALCAFGTWPRECRVWSGGETSAPLRLVRVRLT